MMVNQGNALFQSPVCIVLMRLVRRCVPLTVFIQRMTVWCCMTRISASAGGPETDHYPEEREKYGANRLAEGKLPLCAEMCATKALLAGDGDKVSDIFRERITYRGAGVGAWGWGIAYKGQ